MKYTKTRNKITPLIILSKVPKAIPVVNSNLKNVRNKKKFLLKKNSTLALLIKCLLFSIANLFSMIISALLTTLQGIKVE